MSPSPLPQLPQHYIQQMEQLLGQEADAFLHSYDAQRAFGLRVNSVKWEHHAAARELTTQQFQLRSVPWCEEGFYYDEHSRPGKHPYHAAGLYYIQEPSAMSAVALLDPQPGEFILDLAAAPGGKSTQIAGRMRGEGVLVANEIHPQRAKILAENIERMGIANAIVTQADPHSLAARFPLAFDRIMLDAPCSGEGMFRKDPSAIEEWSPLHVEACAARQWDIIQAAVTMLKAGGTIAYSTCTFNRRENEDIVEKWLAAYPEFQLVRTERIWPHLAEGEGHFVAVFQKTSDGLEDVLEQHAVSNSIRASAKSTGRRSSSGHSERGTSRTADVNNSFRQFEAWAGDHLPDFSLPPGTPLLFGEELYWLPQGNAAASVFLDNGAALDRLRVPRAGLHLAHMRKNRIEPAHALALACITGGQAAHTLQATADDTRIRAFLRGESIALSSDSESVRTKGWMLVTVDGLPLGWGKASDGMLKNHYPKGLRSL
ncbi:RsmB/NOP family class I SAM-dependent RNA methyltransferase [Paenibacillus profundus]|uniref:RsmB/NOP family class I SAM-dependent RNA methyltransferase n=1 Tax=Paenibacillus profundus TaxID=1173085 RepID=A0ABS8YL36_9BACL|nr:RsmB/NOP family class I SAM-dependent RNA methyltransferase [Paenibacillus profundus]MCE5170992.1 RsmB/NOP family class I SAM-dependent RNA methyltransferase [Paenibacillus profundus]